jgi:hypothetical protein
LCHGFGGIIWIIFNVGILRSHERRYPNPSLHEWLPDGQIAFASERAGWSHLCFIDREDSIRGVEFVLQNRAAWSRDTGTNRKTIAVIHCSAAVNRGLDRKGFQIGSTFS